MVFHDVQEISIPYDAENPPCFDMHVDHIDQFFKDKEGGNISLVFLELTSYPGFNIAVANELVLLINHLKPHNEIDWNATFRFYNLGDFNPNELLLESPMKELIAQGYISIVNGEKSNSYVLLKSNSNHSDHQNAISLFNDEVREIFILESMGLVEIYYEVLL